LLPPVRTTNFLLCVAPTRSSSFGRGRPGYQLGKHVGLRLSSDLDNDQSIREDNVHQLSHNSGGPSMARTALFSRPSCTVHQRTSKAPRVEDTSIADWEERVFTQIQDTSGCIPGTYKTKSYQKRILR